MSPKVGSVKAYLSAAGCPRCAHGSGAGQDTCMARAGCYRVPPPGGAAGGGLIGAAAPVSARNFRSAAPARSLSAPCSVKGEGVGAGQTHDREPSPPLCPSFPLHTLGAPGIGLSLPARRVARRLSPGPAGGGSQGRAWAGKGTPAACGPIWEGTRHWAVRRLFR